VTLYKPTITQFLKDVKNHRLEVKLDQGVYRHLICRNTNGSFNQRFEIITAPHTLLIRGDMGAVAFSRVEDMFNFFTDNPGKINPHYWAEKIEGLQHDGSSHSYKFSGEAFRAELIQSLEGYTMTNRRRQYIAKQLREKIDWSDDESYTRRQVEDFKTDDGFEFSETWEISARVPLGRYIWLCRAICWAIGKYREKHNHPGIPESSGGEK
jgi:hypothetical protein